MKKILFLIITCSFCSTGFSSGPGTTSANFLKVSMSARAMGMAGAFSALADDSGAIFSNPAGFAGFDSHELGFGFTNYIQDTKIGNLSYSTKISENKFGLGISFLNVDGIEKRNNADATGIVPHSGTFDANDLALSLAYAKKNSFPNLMDNLDVGFAVKFINSKIDDSSAFAAAFDAGAIYRANEKTNFSFVIQNVGSSMKFEDDSDPLPINLKVGALYKPNPKLNLAAELTQYFMDEKFYPALGAEYWFRDAFALRGGYKFGYDTSNLGNTVGLSLGFGLKTAGIGLDYAYLPFGDLGNVHRFGFWIQF